MARAKSQYVCGECGGTSPSGRAVPQCGAWNALAEAPSESSPRPLRVHRTHRRGAHARRDRGRRTAARVDRVTEFDRVLAGAGSRRGGADRRRSGIGKSTLLLQALAAVSQRTKVLYVSGEESAAQVALRARRSASKAGRCD